MFLANRLIGVTVSIVWALSLCTVTESYQGAPPPASRLSGWHPTKSRIARKGTVPNGASDERSMRRLSSNSNGDYMDGSPNATSRTNGEFTAPLESASPSQASSTFAATVGLIKAMLGSGVLTLPAGLAAISDHPSILWPGNLMLLVLGSLSAYTFFLYGRLVHATQAKSLGELWNVIHKSVGDESSKKGIDLVSLANFTYCWGCCLIYLLIIGDSVSTLLSAVSSGSALPWWTSRRTAILAITGGILYPLCNLSSLAALAPVSAIGVAGSILTTLFVVWRCPAIFPSSPYAADALSSSTKLFRTYDRRYSFAPLVLMANSAMALMAHFSAPDFYHSLEADTTGSKEKEQDLSRKSVSSASPRQRQLKSFAIVTASAFAAVAVVNAVTLTCGFLTFGRSSAGIILTNYAASDVGASLSRLLVTISVVGGFPFLFAACRNAALDLWKKDHTATSPSVTVPEPHRQRRMTNRLLAGLAATALVVKDAGFVVGFNGALMGTAILYIFPALLFLKQTSHSQHQVVPTRRLSWERGFNRGLVVMGIITGLIGAIATVQNSFFA